MKRRGYIDENGNQVICLYGSKAKDARTGKVYDIVDLPEPEVREVREIMSKEKFTPGPWHVEKNNARIEVKGPAYYKLIPPVGNKDREYCPSWAIALPFSAEHDANLIAAAPEMYEALSTLKGLGGFSYEMHAVIERILKKARGEA